MEKGKGGEKKKKTLSGQSKVSKGKSHLKWRTESDPQLCVGVYLALSDQGREQDAGHKCQRDRCFSSLSLRGQSRYLQGTGEGGVSSLGAMAAWRWRVSGSRVDATLGVGHAPKMGFMLKLQRHLIQYFWSLGDYPSRKFIHFILGVLKGVPGVKHSPCESHPI